MAPFRPKLLPIKEIDWTSLIPLIADAHSALARYDGILQGLVNPHILISPLARREAVLSSRIEGTQANMEDVLAFEAEPRNEETPKDADIQKIINYRRALQADVEELEIRPITLNLIKQMHQILMESVRGWDKGPGRLRMGQNYIAPRGTPIDQAVYVPPEPQFVPELLDNFEKYIHQDEVDQLVQLALVHAQFELIHPFADGNGRVGRLLVPLFLYEKRRISFPAFFMSAYLEAHRDEYYSRLSAISKEENFQGWVSFFLYAIAEQARQDTERVKSIRGLYEEMKERVVRLTKSQFAIQVLDMLFNHPIFSAPRFQSQSQIPRPSAGRILTLLTKGEVLRVLRPGKGKRPTIYFFPRLLELVST
jgi:Fic family protein